GAAQLGRVAPAGPTGGLGSLPRRPTAEGIASEKSSYKGCPARKAPPERLSRARLAKSVRPAPQPARSGWADRPATARRVSRQNLCIRPSLKPPNILTERAFMHICRIPLRPKTRYHLSAGNCYPGFDIRHATFLKPKRVSNPPHQGMIRKVA